MMKKISIILFVLLVFSLPVFSAEVADISDIGSGYLLRSGDSPEIYYKFGITAPVVTKKSADSVTTFESRLTTGVFYCNTVFEDNVEFNGYYLLNINRKTIGIGNLYADMGGGLYHVTNSIGGDSDKLGYRLGLGYKFNFANIDLNWNYIPMGKEEPIHLAGLNLNINF